MANVDNLNSMRELDEENILGNIQDFPDQVEKCWQDWQNIALPTPYINAKAVLILGMGGSAQGGGIVADLAKAQSRVPIVSLRDYELPGWVDKNTLVIAVSYSGNTEETIEALSSAIKKTEKIITISTGGKVYSIGSQNRAIHYQIHYGSEPRAALGYILTSLLAIAKKLNLIDITNEEVKETVLLLRALQKKLDVEVPARRNPAKAMAQKLVGRIPIIYGSGSLTEVARRYKGQFNENAKTLSYYDILPELNHNSLVGLEFPENLKQKLFFIILMSKYDHGRNKIRQQITAQILEQRKLTYETFIVQPSSSPVSEVMQVIMFGDFVSYYLAILNNTPPNPVKIIKFLKDKLAEQPLES
jgi:glucose/mannose-6-phosphate isomerase